MDNLASQFLFGKWFVLFAAILVMDASGGSYIFGNYSEVIRNSLGYDQKMLNTLGFFKNLGGGLGFLPGSINDVTQKPWVVLVCGAVLNLAGYVMIYLAIVRRRPSRWRMCLYMAVAAMSQCFASTGAVVSTVKNFPDAGLRGSMLGLLMGFAGLSGAIFTQLHRSFAGVGDDGSALVMLIACLPTAISVLFSPIIRCIPRPRQATTNTGRERKALTLLLYASILVGVYLLGVNVVELKVPRLPKPAYYVTAIVLVLLLVFLPFLIVLHQEIRHRQATTAYDSGTCTTTGDTPAPHSSSREEEEDQSMSIRQALCSVEMLLLLVTTICGIGGVLTAIDNIGQIGESLGYAKSAISIVVSLLSLSNYAGRVLGGFGSEFMLKRYRVPRPLALTLALLVACVGHLIVAFGVRNGLYAASLFIGLSIGAQWPVVFTIVSEVFGLKHFSTLLNLVPLATPLASYVLNVQVTGRLYDREARRQQACWQRTTCIGVRCFQGSFFIIASVTLFGAGVSLVLVWKTKGHYNKLDLDDDEPRTIQSPAGG